MFYLESYDKNIFHHSEIKIIYVIHSPKNICFVEDKNIIFTIAIFCLWQKYFHEALL